MNYLTVRRDKRNKVHIQFTVYLPMNWFSGDRVSPTKSWYSADSAKSKLPVVRTCCQVTKVLVQAVKMISFVGPLHGFHHYLVESSFLDRSYCPKFFRELFRSTKRLLAQVEHCWKALINFTKAFTNSGIYCGNVSSPQLLVHMFLLISHQYDPSEAKLLGTHWHHACW